MATFLQQVSALTGLTIDGSSSPTSTQLSYFLQDGVKDVVNRIVEIRPDLLPRFTATTNSTSTVAKVGRILSVMREHDSVSILRPCTVMSARDRYEATDSSNLKYRSKYSPGYYELNGLLHCLHAAGGSDNDIVVTQVFYDTGVAHGDEVPDNFPEGYAYLVSLYGAVKTLEHYMAKNDTSPAVASDSSGIQLTAVTQLDAQNTIDDFDGNAIEVDQWWTTAAHLIEDEEDTELATLQLQKIQTYVQAYQAQSQGDATEIQLIQIRHKFLSDQYDKSFAFLAPEKLAGAGGGGAE